MKYQRNHGCMSRMGTAKPVYITNAKMKTAAGAIAPASVLDIAPILRKSILIARVQTKLNSMKIKNALGVRRRLVMKYKVRLKVTEVMSLFGKSQIIDAIASENGW